MEAGTQGRAVYMVCFGHVYIPVGLPRLAVKAVSEETEQHDYVGLFENLAFIGSFNPKDNLEWPVGLGNKFRRNNLQVKEILELVNQTGGFVIQENGVVNYIPPMGKEAFV